MCVCARAVGEYYGGGNGRDRVAKRACASGPTDNDQSTLTTRMQFLGPDFLLLIKFKHRQNR